MDRMKRRIAYMVALMLMMPCMASASYTGGLRPSITLPSVWMQQKLVSSKSSTDDLFGGAVAISGNTAFVGAGSQTVGSNADQGEVFVFTYANGAWTQTATLTASDGAADDFFGTSIALSGTTLLVGAPFQGHTASAGPGAVYVFAETAGVWTQAAELMASDGVGGDEFGRSVALDGTTALIGAPGRNSFQGDAYIYDGSSGWATASSVELTTVDGAMNDEFGDSVALSGGTAVVGAPEHQVGSNIQQGQVYVFLKPAGAWATATAANTLLTASDGAARDQFGYSVATTGSTILIGAITHSVNSVQTGAAYVFTKPNTGWTRSSTETAQLRPSDGVDSELFGDAVALTSTQALIGAKWETVSGHVDQGAAYLFDEPSGGWSTTGTPDTEFTAVDGMADAAFGYSVALADSGVFIGAPHYTTNVGGPGFWGVPGEAYGFTSANLALQIGEATNVSQGAQYTSNAMLSNLASGASPAATVTLSIPVGSSLVSFLPASGCTASSTALSCDVGSLPANGQASMSVTLKATGAVGSTLANTATLVGSIPLQSLEIDAHIKAPASSGGGTGGTGSGSGSSGGGGGGVFSLVPLCLLFGLTALRRRRAH